MKKNMGSVDKAIRIITALIILVLYFVYVISGMTAIILLAVAGIFIITRFVGFFPFYWSFGISICKAPFKN